MIFESSSENPMCDLSGPSIGNYKAITCQVCRRKLSPAHQTWCTVWIELQLRIQHHQSSNSLKHINWNFTVNTSTWRRSFLRCLCYGNCLIVVVVVVAVVEGAGRGSGVGKAGLKTPFSTLNQYSAFSYPALPAGPQVHSKSGAFCLWLTPLALRFPPSAYTCLGRNKKLEETDVFPPV